jgi:hypothetical protein
METCNDHGWRRDRGPSSLEAWLRAREIGYRNKDADGQGEPVPPDKWKLIPMIEVAEELHILQNANTIAAEQMARDHRNLIHPGRRARLAERPTRGKAYTAIGGMYGVVDELRREAFRTARQPAALHKEKTSAAAEAGRRGVCHQRVRGLISPSGTA